MGFQREEDGIYRLTVPFKAIYTTVFALNEGGQWVLCDTATTDFDVKQFVLPALRQLDARLDYLFCSHSHADHAGGLSCLRKVFPHAAVITAPTTLMERFEVIRLKGHSEDSLGIFDKKTKTLLSFDCLQQRGIDQYRNGISDKAAYLESIERVRNMDVTRIIFSHDYDPCGYCVSGKEEIENVLNICKEYVLE